MPLDFYCLGCLVYVMMTGTLPHFSGDIHQMVARRAMGEAFAPPTGCSPEAVSLCEGLLEPDPEERLGSREQALEVKRHVWFREVDFFKVLEGAQGALGVDELVRKTPDRNVVVCFVV